VFYLVRHESKFRAWVGELWASDLSTGRADVALPDFLVRSYHVARDGKTLIFEAFDDAGRSRIWIATTDRSRAPRELTTGQDVEERPFWGASGDIFFMRQESGDQRFLYRMKPDGTGREKLSDPIMFLVNVLPDETSAVVWTTRETYRIGIKSREVGPFCAGCNIGPILPDPPGVSWSGDGTMLFVNLGEVTRTGGGTALIPWRGLETIPRGASLPRPDLLELPGAIRIAETGMAPGPSADRYAFTRQAEQSNLYRIPLP
jgi:hypothetical protein